MQFELHGDSSLISQIEIHNHLADEKNLCI